MSPYNRMLVQALADMYGLKFASFEAPGADSALSLTAAPATSDGGHVAAGGDSGAFNAFLAVRLSKQATTCIPAEKLSSLLPNAPPSITDKVKMLVRDKVVAESTKTPIARHCAKEEEVCC